MSKTISYFESKIFNKNKKAQEDLEHPHKLVMYKNSYLIHK